MIARRLAHGTCARRSPGVYVVSGAPPGWKQDLWVAYLAVGRGVLSHETALVLHGLDDRQVRRYPLTLTVGHGDHHWIPGVVVHQLDDVLPHHACQVGGLPVSTPARALIDVAAVVGRRRASSDMPRWRSAGSVFTAAITRSALMPLVMK
jgi:predicted transcriptional regulator of viral defense system